MLLFVLNLEIVVREVKAAQDGAVRGLPVVSWHGLDPGVARGVILGENVFRDSGWKLAVAPVAGFTSGCYARHCTA